MGSVLFVSIGCSPMTHMKTYQYQVEDDSGSWDCESKWVGVANSFPSGRRDICSQVEESMK